jgi:hypothetical protein
MAFTLGNKLARTVDRNARLTRRGSVLRGGLEVVIWDVFFGNQQEILRRLAGYGLARKGCTK